MLYLKAGAVQQLYALHCTGPNYQGNSVGITRLRRNISSSRVKVNSMELLW